MRRRCTPLARAWGSAPRPAAALLMAMLPLAGPISAQDDPAALARAAIDELAAAMRAHDTAQTRRDRVAALTDTVQGYEQGLSALRAGLRQVTLRERALSAALDAKSEEVSRLLGVLATLERSPAPLLLLHPAGPLGTARSGMILAEITPSLAADAQNLRAELDEIRALLEVQEAARTMLAQSLQGAQAARTALAQAIADRDALPPRFTDDPERLRQLVISADTLSGFADGLADLKLPPPDDGSLEPGTLPLPVAGRLIRRAGEPDAAGVARPGLLLATRPRALVTAPATGTIRYTGPLLDYGNVMILEHSAEILLVLAGLAEVYGAPGHVVETGAPLGLMGGLALGLDTASYATSAGTGQSNAAGGVASMRTGAELSETLYIELRQAANPVDPAAWFAIDRQE